MSMEVAIRVAKWKTQIGELMLKEKELSEDLEPKLQELDKLRRDIKYQFGALSEAFQIQLFVEESLRKQGKLGGSTRKLDGSVLDKAEKMEVNESSNDTRSWAKSGSVPL